MKYVRLIKEDNIIPGLVDNDCNVRDLSSITDDIDGNAINSILDNKLNNDTINTLPIVGSLDNVELLAPIKDVGKLICIGANSKHHIQEMNLEQPKDITFFMKAITSLTDPYNDIAYPKICKKLDWEAELAIVIGKKAKYVNEDDALNHIFGFCLLNEISDRYWQFENNNTQYTKGKSFDDFAPIGPYIVTLDEINDLDDIDLELKVNGKVKQSFKSSEYIFNVRQIIAYCSRFFTLNSGDIISFGTGPGVGHSYSTYLEVGDIIELSSTILGKQKNQIISE
ncbi:MAG TPA: fumarylacetoacetate hydrolase family protein [Victivallales bacterium]|nr:fumarylacetoacetate hydrolase family protein [Victivallales bacterium]